MFRKSTLLAVAVGFAAVGSSMAPSAASPLGGVLGGPLGTGSTPTKSSTGVSAHPSVLTLPSHAITPPAATAKFPNAGKVLATPVPLPSSSTSTYPGPSSKVGGIDKLKLPAGSVTPLPGGSTPPGGGGSGGGPSGTGGTGGGTAGSPPQGSGPKGPGYPSGGTGPVVVVTPPPTVLVPPPTVVDAPTTVVAPRFVATRPISINRAATTEPCTCLTKQYLSDGGVLFQDICTKEAAIATPAAQVQNAAPPAQ